MKEYQKIPNVFMFDEKYRNIVGYNSVANTLKDIIWQGTEKIDGTNVRIYWDGHRIEFKGHTEKSQLPENLTKYLTETFLTQEMEYVFEQIFGEKEAYIFGEGYGYKIQANGDKYLPNSECGFIVFDVNIDGWDLKRESVDDIASRLNLPSVPVVFEGTLEEAEAFVSKHPMSTLNNGLHEMEGIILVPRDIQLYDNKHKMIKFKCKYGDMLKANKVVA